MEESYISRHVARTNRNLFVVNALVLATIALIAFAHRNYLYNFARGPFPGDETALVAAAEHGAKQELFVVEGNVAPTGVQETKDGRPTASFLVMPVGAHFALLKVPVGDVPSAGAHFRFAGGKAPIPAYLQTHVINTLPLLTRRAVLPYVLDDDYRSVGYYEIGLAALFALIALWNLWKVFRRQTLGASVHPIMKNLARFGSPEHLASQIEDDFRFAESEKLGRVRLSKSWLAAENMFDVQFQRLSDLVWLHTHVTKHSVNFIPTGKTWRVMVYDRTGVCNQVTVRNEHDAHALIKRLVARAPFAIAGYDAKLAALWKKDRGALIAAVDQQKNARSA
jgi:hypothetical protein